MGERTTTRLRESVATRKDGSEDVAREDRGDDMAREDGGEI